MCSIMKQVEIYPEETRLHLGYKGSEETQRQWYQRARFEQARRGGENAANNFWRLVASSQLSELKAAERCSGYRA